MQLIFGGFLEANGWIAEHKVLQAGAEPTRTVVDGNPLLR
jgi:hypothetical protein